jgi:Sec-independent protein translocase protein TatA
MIVIGAAALLFFGPDQLPKVARKVGTVVRDVQLTSQSFIREMERAADEAELRDVARSPSESRADAGAAVEPPSAVPEEHSDGASPGP